MIYQFGEYEVDTGRAELRRRNALHKIESKVYLLLEILLTHNDRVVTKDEIIKHVWGGRIISDGSIDNTLSAARKAVGDDGKAQKLIKTFPGRGLRFVGDVNVIEDVVRDAPFKETHTRQIGDIRARHTQPVHGGGELASIAVLPFADMSAAGDQSYLGDGIAEELLNVLANTDGLSVTSRTSAFSFRDKTATITEIGAALQVAHVLEGSVRQAGTTLRITAQLIDTKTDKHVWSETYNRMFTAESLLDIQDDISAKIVAQLSQKLNIAPDNAANTTSGRPKSVEAYELYLRAQTLMRERTPKQLRRAVALFKQVIELEPDYVRPYAGLVETYQLMNFYASMGLDEAAKNMRPYVDRGLVLAPGSPETLTAAGVYAVVERRYADAVLMFERALNINPKYVYALTEQGKALSVLGRDDKALKSYEMALVYDPISPAILGNISALRYEKDDFEGALVAARTNMKWNGEAAPALNMMSRLRRHEADYVGAHALLVKAAKTNPDEYFVQSDLVNLYLDVGLDARAVAAARLAGLKARTYALTGHPQKATELAKTDPTGYDAAYAAYIVKDYDFSYAVFGPEVAAYGLTQAGRLKAHEIGRITAYTYVLRQQGDANAEVLLNNLEKVFKGKSPGTTKFPEENLGAAALHMMSGNPDEALRWLDPLIDKGHVYLKLTNEPIFAPLADHPAYATRLKRMQKTAKKYRTAIEKQL